MIALFFTRDSAQRMADRFVKSAYMGMTTAKVFPYIKRGEVKGYHIHGMVGTTPITITDSDVESLI